MKQALRGDVEVTVISPDGRFLFTPSPIWVAVRQARTGRHHLPGSADARAHSIDFLHAHATPIDPMRMAVTTGSPGSGYCYDYLVITTGDRNRMDVVPAWWTTR